MRNVTPFVIGAMIGILVSLLIMWLVPMVYAPFAYIIVLLCGAVLIAATRNGTL